VTTQDALFRAAVEPPSRLDAATKEVLRYRTALRHGYDALRRGAALDIDLLEMCAVLRESPACLRDEEPVIIEDQAASAVVYTPPRGRSRIASLLRNLVDFLARPARRTR